MARLEEGGRPSYASVSYKDEKEAFVSNLVGTTMGEVALVALTIPVSFLLHSTVVSFLSLGERARQPAPGWFVRFSVDFACLAMPMVITFNMPHLIPLVFGCMLALCLALDVYARWRYSFALFGIRDGDSRDRFVGFAGKYKPFLSAYRTSMVPVPIITLLLRFVESYLSSLFEQKMLCTCIAILAVDFPIFPRRFAKTETYGTSLMDLGVGSFLLSYALVYRQTQRKSFKSLILRVLPLVVLGMVRLLTVKGTDYQEHVTEYGVHWNFFFTLSVVSLLAGVCHVSETRGAIYGLILALGYQFALDFGLREYILDAPRINILNQNKEGVFSSIGYFSLFLIGTQLGHAILRDRKTKKEAWYLVFSMTALGALLWVITAAVDSHVERNSRRMMNITYILSAISQNLVTLLLLMAVSLLVRTPERSWDGLVQAINRNQLCIFLVSNLLVGAVNFSLQTLHMDDSGAMIVIACYTLVVCLVAAVLHSLDLTIKFW